MGKAKFYRSEARGRGGGFLGAYGLGLALEAPTSHIDDGAHGAARTGRAGPQKRDADGGGENSVSERFFTSAGASSSLDSSDSTTRLRRLPQSFTALPSRSRTLTPTPLVVMTKSASGLEVGVS